ncbi:Protein of unknown function [Cotesia congregata]|uniref:Uncharacterized protein n=1 Tax=Cotesia congregata TaxID=51543 RepID=A0A8J2HDQ2_COTCN|nr:Protein of unknown function [Cotesia congregata]
MGSVEPAIPGTIEPWRSIGDKLKSCINVQSYVQSSMIISTALKDIMCDYARPNINDACSGKTITVVQLLQQIRGNNIPFYGKVSTLRKLLHDIGFSHIRRNNNRYLVEQPHIIAARIEFLGRYKYYFDRKRRFIFQDETWIFRNGTGKTFEWQDSSTRSVSCNIAIKYNFAILIKKLSMECLIRSEKQPTSAWKKPALINWLTENKIPHDARSTVKDLYALCQSYKKPISHEITEIIHKSGHEVLKTPPYCYFYNPIELVWGFCKRYYDAHVAPDCDYSEKKAMQIWEEALSQVTPERWNRYVDHTEKKLCDYRLAQVVRPTTSSLTPATSPAGLRALTILTSKIDSNYPEFCSCDYRLAQVVRPIYFFGPATSPTGLSYPS